MKEHILEVRERAWRIWPYPCIGLFCFLDLSISLLPVYPEILQRLQSGETLLDVGCCVGQNVRKLVVDGAPAEKVFGVDIQRGFIDIGYDLFLDKGKLQSKFITADVMDPKKNPQWDKLGLEGNVDIIHVGSFIHLFDYDGQVNVSKRLVQILKPNPGVVIAGRQTGNLDPGEFKHNSAVTGTMYRHDDKTFKDMWARVGRETGTRWKVDTWLEGVDTRGGRSTSWVEDDPRTKRLVFVVRRE